MGVSTLQRDQIRALKSALHPLGLNIIKDWSISRESQRVEALKTAHMCRLSDWRVRLNIGFFPSILVPYSLRKPAEACQGR